MLLILFAVTTVQLFHSHPSKKLLAAQKESCSKKAGATDIHQSAGDTRCFICEYQLTRDVDDNHATFNCYCPLEFNSFLAVAYTYTCTNVYTAFETRGPPTV
jgi:hypothetical protein